MRIISAALLTALCIYCSISASALTSAAPAQATTQETSTPASSQPISISPSEAANMLASTEPPAYPQEAKDRKLGGSVKLHAFIGTDGSISQLKVIKATDPIFIDSAIAAVGKWHYKPYYRRGVPVEVETTITVNFKLHK